MNTRRLILLPLALFAATLLACQPPEAPKLSGAGMEMFTPVKMRLHPLSRLAGTVPAPAIEAQIELTDQFGDIGKGVGAITFNLFTYNSFLPSHQGDRLGSWSLSLSTPGDNRTHWDPITRTYLFTLPLTGGKITPGQKLLLAAQLTLPNGELLSDTLMLPAK